MHKKKSSIFLKITVFAFAVYVVVQLLSLQFAINDKKQEIENLQSQIKQQNMENDEVSQLLNDGITDEYMEKIARDKLGLAFPNERIYINPK